MIKPELTQYVIAQLKAGVNIEDIRLSLVSAGWPDDDIKEVMSLTDIPKPDVLDVVNTTESPKESRLGLVIGMLIGLIIVGSGAYAAYHYWKTSPNKKTSPTATPVERTTYSDTGISFKYNSSWKRIDSTSFMKGSFVENPNAKATEMATVLFYNPQSWDQTKIKVDAAVAATPTSESEGFNQAISTFLQSSYAAEFYLARFEKDSALTAANQATQTTCVGDETNFSTDNPIVPTRVHTTTVNGVAAYYVEPQSECLIKTTQVFFDSKSTTATPEPSIPGVTTISETQPSSPYDCFVLSFNSAANLVQLSTEQKAVLDSVTLP